jgi:phospholipid/cholesterol/gamma-HCH transport system substrate-binding protein
MAGNKWVRPIAFVATMIVVVGGLAVFLRGGKSDRMTVTAHFSRAVGLYPGSSVRVLGVKVGTVRSIKPDGPAVTVVMDLPVDTPIPAEAKAVIIPPSLVSDRYVEMTPVYDGGARLEDGAQLDVDHTMTPVELDEILGSLDTFLVAMGPNGANKDGSLGRLVDIGAKDLGKGGGKALNETLTNLAQAVHTLSGNSGDLTGVIANLAAFTDTLARNDSRIRTLTGDLAQASQFLAGESDALQESLKNLANALGEIASLVREHRSDLGADIQTLAKVAAIVVKNKKSLTEALDVLPLGTANLASTVNTEKHTLDIRNDNHQADNPSELTCHLLALLGQPCPPTPGAPGSGASLGPASGTPSGPAGPASPSSAAARASAARAAAARAAREADRVTDALSLRGLFGSAS